MITEWQLFEAGHCCHPEIAVRRDGSLKPCAFPSLAAALHHRAQGWLLFDTGYASHFLHATDPFPERLYRWTTPVHGACEQALVGQLQARGIAAEAIGHVVLSHLHGDHVAGVADFPQAQVYCDHAAWQHQLGCNRVQATANGYLPALLAGAGPRLQHFQQLPPPARCRPNWPGLPTRTTCSVMAVCCWYPCPGTPPAIPGCGLTMATARCF